MIGWGRSLNFVLVQYNVEHSVIYVTHRDLESIHETESYNNMIVLWYTQVELYSRWLLYFGSAFIIFIGLLN